MHYLLVIAGLPAIVCICKSTFITGYLLYHYTVFMFVLLLCQVYMLLFVNNSLVFLSPLPLMIHNFVFGNCHRSIIWTIYMTMLHLVATWVLPDGSYM
jgi:hypothetical protein